MDKRKKSRSDSPKPLLQRCAQFACVLIFALTLASGERRHEEVPGGHTEMLPNEARGVAVTGGHDEEGLPQVGTVASLGQPLGKISKRSIYDSRIPPSHPRYLQTRRSTPFGTTSYDWDTFHDPVLPWGGEMKRGGAGDSWDYGDSWWGRPTPKGDATNANTYMESAYIPHHFFGGFKRALPYPRAGAYLRRPFKGNGQRGETRIMPPAERPITRRRRGAPLVEQQIKPVQEKPIYMRKRHPSHQRDENGNSGFHDSMTQPGTSYSSPHDNAKAGNKPKHNDVSGRRREIMKRRAEIVYRRFLGNQL